MDIIERAAERLRKPIRETLVEKAADKLRQADAPASAAAPAAEVAAGTVAPAAPALDSVGIKPAAPRARRRVTIDFERLRELGLVVPTGDRTRLSEEFRMIKRPLLLRAFARGGDRIKNGHLIMVTSARPGEGKTFSSVSLAMSIASERDLTVLLVDADIPNPSVLKTLGLEADVGLVDVLDESNTDLSEVLLRTNLDNLSILPTGRRHSHSTELLASERMAHLVEEIAQRYPDRVIIFDSPPLLASSEPSVIALHVGQIVMVVEAEKTSESAVREALDLVSHCPNVSMVLNKAQSRIGTESFGSYYDSYYGKR